MARAARPREADHVSVPSKAALRTEMRVLLGRVSAPERALASAAAGARLKVQEIWQTAGGILLYAPRPDELDLLALITEALARGKVVALPRYVPARQAYEAARISEAGGDMRPGRFGLIEPAAGCPSVPLNQLDLALVPGVCFDESGRRLGRGKGYYDRLLAGAQGARCGVAFDQQIQRQVPAEPHDLRMDFILTPTRWLRIGRSPTWK